MLYITMNLKINILIIYLIFFILIQNAENRPLSCSVIDEKFGSMLCCKVHAGNSNCRTLIPKNSFHFVKTWPLETVKHANLLLHKFHKNQVEDHEFSSQFVSSDFYRREQIEVERELLRKILTDDNEKDCCCENVKKLIIPDEGYSYNKDNIHKIYQELPLHTQVLMNVSCINSSCTQNFKKYSCTMESAYVPLFVIDKEFPDYLHEVPIEVSKGCTCEEEFKDHAQHLTQNFKKELFKRFAKYDKIDSHQIKEELDSIRSMMKNNMFRSHNVSNTFKLFENVVKNFNRTYSKATEKIKLVNKSSNKEYEENFFDAASLILIATKLLNFNISYTDSNSRETVSLSEWEITSHKLSDEIHEQTQSLDARVASDIYKTTFAFDENSREPIENVTDATRSTSTENAYQRIDYLEMQNNTTDLLTENPNSLNSETEQFGNNNNLQSRFSEEIKSTTLQDISLYRQGTEDYGRKIYLEKELEGHLNENSGNNFTLVPSEENFTEASTLNTTLEDFSFKNFKISKTQDQLVDNQTISSDDVFSPYSVYGLSDEKLILKTTIVTDLNQSTFSEKEFKSADFLQTFPNNSSVMVTDNSDVSKFETEIISNSEENKAFWNESSFRNKSISKLNEILKQSELNVNKKHKLSQRESVVTESKTFTKSSSRHPHSSEEYDDHINLIKSATTMIKTETPVIMTNNSEMNEDPFSEKLERFSFVNTEKTLDKSNINHPSTENLVSSTLDSSYERKTITFKYEDMKDNYTTKPSMFIEVPDNEFNGASFMEDYLYSSTANTKEVSAENLTKGSHKSFITATDSLSNLGYSTSYKLQSRPSEVDQDKSTSELLQGISRYTQVYEDNERNKENSDKESEEHFNETSGSYHSSLEFSEDIFTDTSTMSTTNRDIPLEKNVTLHSSDKLDIDSLDYIEFGKTVTESSDPFTVTSTETNREGESNKASNKNFELNYYSYNSSGNVKSRDKNEISEKLIKISEGEIGMEELERDSVYGVSTSISVDLSTNTHHKLIQKNSPSQLNFSVTDNQVTLSENVIVSEKEITPKYSSVNDDKLSEDLSSLTSVPTLSVNLKNSYEHTQHSFPHKDYTVFDNQVTLSEYSIVNDKETTSKISSEKYNPVTKFEESLLSVSVADKKVKPYKVTSIDSSVFNDTSTGTDNYESKSSYRDDKIPTTSSEFHLEYKSLPDSDDEIRTESPLLDKIIQSTTLGTEKNHFFIDPFDEVNNTTTVVTMDSYLKIPFSDKSVDGIQPKLIINLNDTRNLIKNTEIKNAYESLKFSRKSHVCNKFSGNCSLYCECCMNVESSYNETKSKIEVPSESRVKKQANLNFHSFPPPMNHFSETYSFLNSILNRENEEQLDRILGKAENLLKLENELLRNKISLLQSMIKNNIPHNLGDLFTEGKLYKNALIKKIFSFATEEIYKESKLSKLGQNEDKIENIQILKDLSSDLKISPLAFHTADIILKNGFINCKDYEINDIASIIAMSEILSTDVQHEVNRFLKSIEDLLKSSSLDRFISSLFAFKNGEKIQLSYDEENRIGIVKIDLEKYLAYNGDLQKCKSQINHESVSNSTQNFVSQNMTNDTFTVLTLIESTHKNETTIKASTNRIESSEIYQTDESKFPSEKLSELSSTFSTEEKYTTRALEETSTKELNFSNDTLVTESIRNFTESPLTSFTSETIFSQDLNFNYDGNTSDIKENFTTSDSGTSTNYFKQSKLETIEESTSEMNEGASIPIATTESNSNFESSLVGITENITNVSETTLPLNYQGMSETTENIWNLTPWTSESNLDLDIDSTTNKHLLKTNININHNTEHSTHNSEETTFTTQISSSKLNNINTEESKRNISNFATVERKRIHIVNPPPQYQPIDIDINKVLKLIKGKFQN